MIGDRLRTWNLALRERYAPGRTGRPPAPAPVRRLLATVPPERAELLAGAGLDAARLRELAGTPDGERQVRALLTAPAPAPHAVLPLDRAGTDALLDALGEDNRDALRHRGLDVGLLRRLCGTPQGLAFVRGLLLPPPLPPAAAAGPPAAPEALPGAGRVALAWARVVAGAFAGVLLCTAAGALIGGAALLVVLACLVCGTAVMALTVPFTRGRGPACAAVAVAFAVLAGVAAYSVPDWYLAVRGVAVRATVAAPSYRVERGTRVPRCRVRLPDGRVREVAGQNTGCARAEVGRRTTVMDDPSGWFAPHLGGPAGLDPAPTVAVAGSAGAVLVLAPAWAVAAAAAQRRRRGTARWKVTRAPQRRD